VISRLEAVAAAEPDAVQRLRLLFSEQVIIEVRDHPDFLPLLVKIRLSAPELRDRLLELRRDHEAVFLRVAEQVRITRNLDRAVPGGPLSPARNERRNIARARCCQRRRRSRN
jgi:hypothetical protein